MSSIPIEQVTEGWWWVEEEMPPFKPQRQIVLVQAVLHGGDNPMDADQTLMAYPVRAEKCPSFRPLNDYIFLRKVLPLEESIGPDSMVASRPGLERPVDPDAPIDPSLMEKITWTKSEIIELIEETVYEDHDAKGCDVDLGENTKIS